MQGDQWGDEKRQAEGMAEDLAASNDPHVGIELGTGPFCPGLLRSCGDPEVVLGEIDIVIDRDGVGHERVMWLVATDQVGADQPRRGMQHKEQNEDHR